jgi:hypothetical protein
METFQQQVKRLLELTGLNEGAAVFDIDNRRIDFFVNEGDWIKKRLPEIVGSLDHLIKLMAHKNDVDSFFVDVNNYRKEREQLIVQLAKAAAKKATIARELVELPTMNAYERRLVHMELSVHPDVQTESEGEGRERRVVVKPIQD